MKRYVIERDLPGVGGMSREQLKGAAATSNAALAKLAGKAQWVQSYVADNKTFCIYVAEDEKAVQEHARLSIAGAIGSRTFYRYERSTSVMAESCRP